MRKIDLTGLKFGRLIAINRVNSYVDKHGRLRTQWLCGCDCGQTIIVMTESLRGGNTKSCGCIQKDGSLKFNYIHGESHGKNKTKEYRTWQKIKSRCYCKTDKKYNYYGGRGIEVCDRWIESYNNFLEDIDRCPKGMESIERINNDGNYEPNNCRWATFTEQAQNKTTTILININGNTMNMHQWCKKLGLNPKIVQKQIKYKNKTLQEIIQNKYISIIN